MSKKIITFLLCCLCSINAYAFNPKGETYYTKVNVWYEDVKKISTTYNKGAMIPAGTKVTILSLGRKKVKFCCENESVTCIMRRIKKYSIPIKKEAWFKKYFSKVDITKKVNGFTELEKSAIKLGEVYFEMSKAAVLMAYGYPPSHVTPMLSSNTWVYWQSKFKRKKIEFEDEKVAKINSKRNVMIVSTYKSWEIELAKASKDQLTVDDVSLLLGTEPLECKQIESPSHEITQCYWEVSAGKVNSSGGGFSFGGQGNTFGSHGYSSSSGFSGGSGGFSRSSKQRFFRASCRFCDGFAVNCQSDWQK